MTLFSGTKLSDVSDPKKSIKKGYQILKALVEKIFKNPYSGIKPSKWIKPTKCIRFTLQENSQSIVGIVSFSELTMKFGIFWNFS